MTRHPNPARQRRGVAMILVMVAIAIAFTLSFAALASQAPSVQLSRNIVNRSQARMIAESGLAMAVRYVQTDANWRSTQPQGVWVQNQVLADGNFTLQGQDGYDSNGDGNVEGSGNFSDSTHAVTLTSTGRYKGAIYAVQAVLTPKTQIVLTGIVAVGNSPAITMGTSAVIDSYNSTLGGYSWSNHANNAHVSTNSTANGGVNLGTGATLGGTISVGPGSDANKVVTLGTGASVTGSKTNLSQTASTPTITAPDLGSTGNPKTYPIGGTYWLSQNLHVSSLTVDVGAKLKISGDVTIVTEGAFSINTGASVEVLPNSSLKVYCKGALTMNTGADNVVDGSNLSRMTFYNLSSTPVSLQTGGSLQGVLISPNAPVNASTGFRLYGVVIAQGLSLGTGCAFHEDIRITSGLDPVTSPSASGTTTWRTQWVYKQ